MAIVLQVGDQLSARAWCTQGSQASVNTYNYIVAAAVGGTVTDQDLANAVDVIVAATYKGIITTAASYNGVQVYFTQRVSGQLPAPVSQTASAGAGTGTLPPTPPNVAAIMKYSTFLRGPGGRGRIYFPFASTTLVDADGTPTATYNTVLDGLATLLLAPLLLTNGAGTAGLFWGLKKRLPGPTVLYQTDIIQSGGSAHKFGQMHKRGSYGKPNVSPI